jgi:hypothetical protein
VLDTNIVTAYLKRNATVRGRIRDAELAGQPVRLSAVSYYETKRGSWGLSCSIMPLWIGRRNYTRN